MFYCEATGKGRGVAASAFRKQAAAVSLLRSTRTAKSEEEEEAETEGERQRRQATDRQRTQRKKTAQNLGQKESWRKECPENRRKSRNDEDFGRKLLALFQGETSSQTESKIHERGGSWSSRMGVGRGTELVGTLVLVPPPGYWGCRVCSSHLGHPGVKGQPQSTSAQRAGSDQASPFGIYPKFQLRWLVG